MQGKSKLLKVTPVITATSYSANDQLGAVTKLSDLVEDSSDTATIMSIVVIDKAKQKADLDVLFFDALPTVTSSDGDALNISDAEMVDKFVGRVKIAAADYTDTAASSDASAKAVGLLIQSRPRSADLWMVLQAVGTPTYSSVSDLTLKIGVLQD